MATAPSPNDLTRQQLDELDALLQKMLSGSPAPVETPPPVQPLREPPVPPLWRADAVAAPPAPHVELPEPAFPPVLKFEPPPAPVAPAPVAPKPTPAPVPAPAPPPAAKAPAPAPKPAPAVVVAPVPVAVPVPAARPVATPAPAPPPPVPLLAWPFVALNATFDAVCGLFGPPGRLLRSGFFKHLYGLAGLGLLLYTAARVAQVQGWVELPVELPWPE